MLEIRLSQDPQSSLSIWVPELISSRFYILKKPWSYYFDTTKPFPN